MSDWLVRKLFLAALQPPTWFLKLITYKSVVPVEHNAKLDALAIAGRAVLNRMLANRNENTSKFYKEVPCVVAKGLIRKYQRDSKCKRVRRFCLPICGDKGKQVKLVEGGIRISAVFKRAIIPCRFPLPVQGFIRHVELSKHNGRWFMSYQYNTLRADTFEPIGVVGVDRNNVGNIATLANTLNGQVRFLGFNADR